MNLEELGITKEDLLDKIAGHIIDEIRDNVLEDIRKTTRENTQQRISATVSEVISEAARSTLDGTFQPVNCFGEKTDKPTTLRDIFVQRTREWWTQKVDRAGKPTSSYGAFGTMAEWHISEVVTKIVREEMNAAFVPIIAQSKAQLSAAITAAIAEIVAKQLK